MRRDEEEGEEEEKECNEEANDDEFAEDDRIANGAMPFDSNAEGEIAVEVEEAGVDV